MSRNRSLKTTWKTLASTLRTAPRIAARPRPSARMRRLFEGLVSTRKRLQLGGRRTGKKDTVFLLEGPVAHLPVVGSEQSCGVIEGELVRALPAPRPQVGTEAGVGPKMGELPGHLGDVAGVEQQSRVADHVWEPGRGG